MEGVIRTLTVNREGMEQALSPDLLATDLAELIANRKKPRRKTRKGQGR